MLILAEQNRAFGYAAAASLGLHALLLLMKMPALREAPAPPPEPPLVARLVEPAPPPAPTRAPPAKPEPEKPAPKKPIAKAKPQPRPKPAVAPPAPAPEPPPAAAPEPEIPEGIDQGAAPEFAPVAPAPPVAVVAPAAPTAPPPDPAAALARFRQELVDLAVRYKRYPRVALDNGWTGDVVVRIDVTAGGSVAAIKVKTSSGYQALDEQALEMFRKAAPEVAVPAALRGKDFSVEVRAIYNLQDRPS